MKLAVDLKQYCKNSGADLVGVAGLDPLRKSLRVAPKNLLDSYGFGIALGMRLKDEIIEGIIDSPTPEYARHYRSVNKKLDKLASQVARWIAEKGFRARAIPASRLVEEKNLLGNISHKAVAGLAGLGWQGKSLLIINPDFGPRIRLATVLTDMPLPSDQPMRNRCGDCAECVRACPANAIKNVSTESHYVSREVAVDMKKCNNKLFEFKAMPGIGSRVCGVCVKVCPWGAKK